MFDRKSLEDATKDYDGDKYHEEFYSDHLKVLRSAQEFSEDVKKAVKYLFLWKLGKVSLRKTNSSSKLDYSDSKGRFYFSIKTTETNQKIMKKATDKEMLQNAFSFRENQMNYNGFKQCVQKITTSNPDKVTSVVLKTFYVHIWRPDEFPIFDTNVWKAFYKEKGKLVCPNTKPHSFLDYEKYTPFFKKLVQDTGLDWRTVDRGLWVIGKRLAQKARKNRCVACQMER